MTPDDFLKDLTQTANVDQELAGVRTMATMYATFYVGMLSESVEPYPAMKMTLELMRCTIGDHKPLCPH